jgi:uncharacterized membrane protein
MELDMIYERYKLGPLLMVGGMLLAVALIGSIATPTLFSTLLSLVVALFIYMVVPGYILLLNVELDDVERVVLSTSVGISLIPLLLFNLNLFWFRISRLNVMIVIIAVIAAGVLLKEKEELKKLIPKRASSQKGDAPKAEALQNRSQKEDAPKDITLTEDNVVKV